MIDARLAHPKAAVAVLAGAYALFTVWMFVAWYSHHQPNRKFKWGGDGWLGPRTYAGGADKFGHAWSTMSLARLGTYILTAGGGYGRRKASLFSAALSQLLFTGVEVRDGTFYEFSFSDLAGDASGAILALLLDNFPRLDELVDYRVQYFPSEMYKRKVLGTSPCLYSGCSRWNVAEDYSGETYLLAFHLAGIKAIRNTRFGSASRFVDVAAGFDTRNYKPDPDADVNDAPRQEMFAGLAFNAQGFFDWLLEDRKTPGAQKARKVAHGLFEVFNLPGASIPLIRRRRFRPPNKPRQLHR